MNVFHLSGNTTRDLELQTSETDVLYTRITLAVDNRRSKNPDRKADFITFTVFGAEAERAVQYINKGRHIEVSGRGSTRTVVLEGGASIEVPSLIATNIEYGRKPRSGSGSEEECPPPQGWPLQPTRARGSHGKSRSPSFREPDAPTMRGAPL